MINCIHNRAALLPSSVSLDQTTAYKSTRIPNEQRVTGNCSIIDILLYSKGKRSAGEAYSLPPLLQHSIILLTVMNLIEWFW